MRDDDHAKYQMKSRAAKIIFEGVEEYLGRKTESFIEEEVNTTLGGNEVWYLPLIGFNPFDKTS